MLSFIPAEWIAYAIHAIFSIGIIGIIIGTVGSKLPFISLYGNIVKAIAGIFLVAGLFLEGYHYASKTWIEATKEFERKVQVAEEKSKQQNVKIVEKVVKQIEIVRETANENKQIIKDVVAKDLDNQCSLPNSAVVLHDSASQNQVSRSTQGTVGGTSDVKASEVLEVIVDNYATCYEIRTKLKAWQEWYQTQKQIYEEVK
jgi:hypothetical protein